VCVQMFLSCQLALLTFAHTQMALSCQMALGVKSRRYLREGTRRVVQLFGLLSTNQRRRSKVLPFCRVAKSPPYWRVSRFCR